MDDTVRVLSTLALKGAVERSVRTILKRPAARGSMPISRRPWRCWSGCARGEAADVVILTREGLDEVAREGRVAAESCVDLARSYVGIAVKAGAAHPDIATEPALRAALLAARSVAYSRLGASGILFAQLIERLGIASEINARAVIIPQGFTAERLVTGEADLAVQQISELKQVAGSRSSVQSHTTCKRLRCFPPDAWRRRTRPRRRTGCCGISLRPKSRRCCARAGSSLEFAGAPTQPAWHEETISRLAVLVAAAVAAAGLAHAQSADLVLCDRVAADPSDPDKPADVKGVPDIAASDIATAIKYCKIAANSSRRAMYQLGRAYAANRQTPEAIAAWRKAADKGSTSAMVELGVLYGTGAGVARDEAQARKLFERAARSRQSARRQQSRRARRRCRRIVRSGACARIAVEGRRRPMPRRSISSA